MLLSHLLLAVTIALPAPADLQKTLDEFVAQAPGAVVAVGTIDHGTAHVYFAGKPPAGAPALNERTEFQIGSITKTFTATALAELVLQKRMSLDDPISRYLPGDVHPPEYNGKGITIGNLAEQNSGLPRLPTNMTSAEDADPYAPYTTKDLYAFLSGFKLTRAPGAQVEYSNLGVGLLGQLLANREKMSYPQVIDRLIFTPLGMHDSSATVTPAIKSKLMPGFGVDLSPQPAWDFTDASAGAGAINSTISDMMRYLRANMQAPRGPLGNAMEFAHHPRVNMDSNGMERVGLAWMVAQSGLTWHNGETGGYSSFLGFTHDVGVVILTNVAAGDNVTLLGIHLLEPTHAPNVAPIAPPPTPHGNSPYAGVYELTPQFKITVFEEHGTLYAQATGQQRLTLVHESGDMWKFQEVAASLTFNRDGSGKVISLVLHQNGRDVPGKRITP